jgi:hypothetical protein
MVEGVDDMRSMSTSGGGRGTEREEDGRRSAGHELEEYEWDGEVRGTEREEGWRGKRIVGGVQDTS